MAQQFLIDVKTRFTSEGIPQIVNEVRQALAQLSSQGVSRRDPAIASSRREALSAVRQVAPVNPRLASQLESQVKAEFAAYRPDKAAVAERVRTNRRLNTEATAVAKAEAGLASAINERAKSERAASKRGQVRDERGRFTGDDPRVVSERRAAKREGRPPAAVDRVVPQKVKGDDKLRAAIEARIKANQLEAGVLSGLLKAEGGLTSEIDKRTARQILSSNISKKLRWPLRLMNASLKMPENVKLMQVFDLEQISAMSPRMHPSVRFTLCAVLLQRSTPTLQRELNPMLLFL